MTPECFSGKQRVTSTPLEVSVCGTQVAARLKAARSVTLAAGMTSVVWAA